MLERREFALPSDAPRDDLSTNQPASEKTGWTGSPDASKTGDRPFITTWKTTSPNESITIPVHRNITGNFERIRLNGDQNNAPKMQSIERWDDVSWMFMKSAFYGAENMVYHATGIPDLSEVTDMSDMFARASSFDGDTSTWDVSGVTDMSQMFFDADSFNGDVSEWDVSGVTDMSRMFLDADSFNGDVSEWDVSGVTDMSRMFLDADSFNGDISTWDVSGVTNMDQMFIDADSFTQNLGSWYITLDDTSIDDGDATRTVGNISAQNSFLGGQSLRYSIAPGGDGDAFEIDGTVLKLKSTPNYTNKSSYTVTISSTGEFGTSNSETFEIRVV